MKSINGYRKGISTLIVVYLIGMLQLSYAQTMVDSTTAKNVQPANTLVGENWVLDFSDEFGGENVNTHKWTINNSTKSRAARPKLGISQWFWKPENVWLEDGKLILQVKKHNSNTMHCGSIFSSGKYKTTYGYFEARIKIAEASKGTHTAFWLQGTGMSNVDGTANDGAEIDIFESAWLGDYTKSVVHIDGYGASHQANTKQYSTPGIHEGYHTWGLHWTKDFMKIYYDGVLKVSYSDPKWVVQADEYLWLSDGASFGFEGDNFTREAVGVLTQAEVDYIRVWKDSSSVTEPIGNLIQNGDFESSSTAFWSESNSDIIISEDVYHVIDESNYCRMPGVPNGRSISQTVSVEPGEQYEFSFSGRIQNSHAASAVNNHSSNGPATLKGEILNGSEVVLSLASQENTNTTMKDTVAIPEGVKAVTVKISKDWNVAYVDNVELKKIVTTNVPIVASSANIDLKVFPNPAQHELHIESNSMIEYCQLFNCNGIEVRKKDQIKSFETGIDLADVHKGMYILNIAFESGEVKMHKVLIK